MYGLIELEIFSYPFRLGGRLILAALMDSSKEEFLCPKDHTADYVACFYALPFLPPVNGSVYSHIVI